MGQSHAWAVIFKGSPAVHIFVVPGNGIAVLIEAIGAWAGSTHPANVGHNGWQDVIETKHLGEAVNLREFVEAATNEANQKI